MTKRVPCPSCGKPAAWSKDNRWRPFCSERCRLIDLGAWIEGDYRVPADDQTPPPTDDDAGRRGGDGND